MDGDWSKKLIRTCSMQADENTDSYRPHMLYVLLFNEDVATTSAFVSNSAANTLQINYTTASLRLCYGWIMIRSRCVLYMCYIFSLFQVSHEQLFADVAKDILLYVSRDLSDKVNHLQPCYMFMFVCMWSCFCFLFLWKIDVLTGTPR